MSAGDLRNALIESGWWPPDEPLSESWNHVTAGDNLLSRLADAPWCGKAHRAQVRRNDVMRRAIEAGAQLTFGWPGLDETLFARWLGVRWLWWPRGVPHGRKVAWVSSRLGRAIDERPDWFAVLRTAAAKLDVERDVLLTASRTTTDRFLERAATLFGLRLLRIECEQTRSFVDWLRAVRRQMETTSWPVPMETNESPATGDEHSTVWLSPPAISPSVTVGEPDAKLASRPLPDRVLLAAADQLVALQVRPGGHLDALLRRRLAEATRPAASVWVALGDRLVPPKVADELQSLGAVAWVLQPKDGSTVAVPWWQPAAVDAEPESDCVLATFPWADGQYLVHWTRRRDGPWPEQTPAEFLDELLFSAGAISHSAFATLVRIVKQKRLVASSAGIRGGFRVVSFSETSLSELRERRIFRGHRGRWDAEPYGLCVRLDWLRQCGAKPVNYGDDELWTTLTDAEQPFFQLRYTRALRGAAVVDWSEEREWRTQGDVDFSQATLDAAILFVPSVQEARQLAVVSPWPVVVLK